MEIKYNLDFNLITFNVFFITDLLNLHLINFKFIFILNYFI